jgi:hypothetical protein
MRRCLDCKQCKPFPVGHEYYGQYYCDDSGDGISTEDLLDVENDCEVFQDK